ncbi:MAG: glycosyltransferase family 2 protein [Ferrovibrio sp.]
MAVLPPEGEAFGPCAAAALFRADAFRAAGGFDESLFCYMEDVDLAFRLRFAGERAMQIPAARVRHVGGGSVGGSEFAVYHGARNSVWCFVKNIPAALLWPLSAVESAGDDSGGHKKVVTWRGRCLARLCRRPAWAVATLAGTHGRF